MADIKLQRFTQREHAEPVHKGNNLSCSMCGAEAVEHLALADGWTAAALPTGGVGYICTKQICREAARAKGVPA